MPYIKKEDRKVFDECIYELSNTVETEGELNYCISTLLHLLLTREGISYKNVNKLVGVLECVKLELYSQLAGPYETIKKLENGDISNLREKLVAELMKSLKKGK